VVEPSRHDSGPAVAVAAALAAARDPEAVVAVFASDHVITKQGELLAACVAAAAAAEQGFIVVIVRFVRSCHARSITTRKRSR
jgi:mannose-1-phosphate guanylyltransferase/mannose-6-phosphate isomerase